ncbi:MAG: 6-phosphogluconolactonase [Pseudomonadota bacterium]
MGLELHRFPTTDLAARALAQAVAADLEAALTMQERALLLVSGGRSPISLFAALAQQPLQWQRIDISLADERSMPTNADAANAGLVRNSLMVGAASAARWIPLMTTEVFAAAADPWQAAQQAASLANSESALATPAATILGLGNDGHTASLFPDALQWPHAAETEARYVALQPTQAPHARVSLSLKALRQQKRCYLWAVGADKLLTLTRLRQVCSEAAAQGIDGSKTLLEAGPVACLIADPVLQLRAYCTEPVDNFDA